MNNAKTEKIMGTMGLENKLYQNVGKIRYDENGRQVLKHKEVLANILKYAVPEYEKCACEEIMTLIDSDSIRDDMSIAPDTNTQIEGSDTAQISRCEANMAFDVLFKVIEPRVENEKKNQVTKKNIHLHVDVELQGDYYPGYPIEKRGIYNLSRMISSQLEVVTKKTNYNVLEKSYCIFICIGRVPKYLWNTVSYWEFSNTKNVGHVEKKSQDLELMNLVIIRIGEQLTEGVADIIHFLHGLFYNVDEVEEYIDFSQNQKFREELRSMALTGEHLIEYGEHRQMEKTEKERKRADDLEKQNKLLIERLNKMEKQIEILRSKINE